MTKFKVIITKFSSLISYGLYFGIILYLFFKYYNKLPDLINVNISHFIFLLLCSSAYLLISGYIFGITLRFFDIKLNFKEIFGLSILNHLGGYLLPYLPGSAIRAVYLKKIKKLKYIDFGSSLIALLLISNVIVGIFAFVVLQLTTFKPVIYHLLLICCLCLIVSPVPVILMSRITKNKTDKLSYCINGFFSFLDRVRSRKYRFDLISFIFSTLSSIIIGGLTVIVSCSVFNFQISFFQGIAIMIFTSISGIFSLTPNNIGIQETIFSVILISFGCTKEIGIASALVNRLAAIIVAISLAPICYKQLFTKNNIKLFG